MKLLKPMKAWAIVWKAQRIISVQDARPKLFRTRDAALHNMRLNDHQRDKRIVRVEIREVEGKTK